MKKILKGIVIGLCCVLTVVSSFFIVVKRPNSFVANAVTNEYTGSLTSDYTGIPDYAITSVESVNLYGTPVWKISCKNTLSYYLQVITLYNSSTASDAWNNSLFWFYNQSSGSDTLNWCIIGLDSNIYCYRNGHSAVIYCAGGKSFDLYFSYRQFSGVSNNQPTFVAGETRLLSYGYTNSDYFIDMSSDTNFSFYFNFLNSSSNQNYNYRALMSWVFNDSSKNSSYSSLNGNGGYNYLKNSSGNFISCKFSSCSLSSLSGYAISSENNNNGFYFLCFLSGMRISVYRPVARVNNTLIIYNFDFPAFISDVSYTSYSLRRDTDYYNISYSGSLNNSYYNLIYNDDVQNTIFDEYIDVYFNVDSSLRSFSYNSDSNYYYYASGFDFNFTYYAQPLVASNGSYNYTFQKPSYVDGSITFSIVPPKLNIPILAWVENAFIFLCFYCPIISDIVSLLYLDRFLGGLIQLFNFFVSSGIGDFILSCFAFLLYFMVLKSLFPVLASGLTYAYNDTQFAYNRRRRKEEKNIRKRNKKELKYQYKQIDKSYKRRAKNRERGLPD